MSIKENIEARALRNAMNNNPHYVCIAGPDDIVKYPNKVDALQAANEINKLYLEQRLEYGDDAPLLIAVVKTKEEIEAEA